MPADDKVLAVPRRRRGEYRWTACRRATLVVLCGLSFVGCDNFGSHLRNLCPPDLKGGPKRDSAGIQWGKDKAKVEASIMEWGT